MEPTENIHDTIHEFSDYLKALGYGKSTREMVAACVKDFLEHATTSNPEELNAVQIRSFYGYLQTKPGKRRPQGLSSRYIAHHVYGLKVFFNWLESTQRIEENPMSGLRFAAAESAKREALSKEEITQLFEVAETSRERAILHVFYSAGLRRNEGENLNAGDLDGNTLEVRNGKGGKSRTVPLPKAVAKELHDYLGQPENRKSPLLKNAAGGRLRGNTCNRIFKELCQRAGINREVSLHHLRHSIATHLLEAGLRIEQVRDFLGHKSLEATQIYLSGQLSVVSNQSTHGT